MLRGRTSSSILPAVSAGAGTLLTALTIALAVWSLELLKDGLRAECAARATAITRELRHEQERMLIEAASGARRPPEVAALWRVAVEGAVQADPPERAPPARLLAGVAAHSGALPLPVADVGPSGLRRPATWAPAAWLTPRSEVPAGLRGVLVEWDLERLRQRQVAPRLDDPSGRYAGALIRQPAELEALPFHARALVALDPPLSGWRLAVGLQDAGGLRRSLRVQTALLGLLAAWLLAVLGGSLFLYVRRQRARSRELLARERFLTRAYHELQTPLALLRASAETVARGAATRPADLARCLDILLREEARLTSTVRRLLRYLRLQASGDEAGTRELLGASEPLGEAVRQAVEEARPALEAAGLQVEVRIAAAAAGRRAPGELARDTVTELLANARKHATGATRVEVVLEAVGQGAVGQGARLIVADDGPGLGDPARAFVPWEGAGSGLGLALLREGWAALGGQIAAAPAARGARLEVSVPPGAE